VGPRGASFSAQAATSIRAAALLDKEHWAGLPLHYLFGAIPVGGNAL
jgi:hypothetical protein